MLLCLYFSLLILNLFFVLSNRESKFLCVMTILYMGLLFVSNSGTAGDAYKYKMDFELDAFLESSEIGYRFLKEIVHSLGINSYNGFLAILFCLAGILIFCGLHYFELNYHTIFAISMAFIFPTFAVAIRFFIAMAVIFFSIHFLLDKKYIKYLSCVIIAALFHKSAILYVLFVFCMPKSFKLNEVVRKLCMTLIISVSILSVFNAYITKKFLLLDFVRKVVFEVFLNIENNKINAYTETITQFGAFIFFIIYLFSLYFSYLAKKRVQKEFSGYVNSLKLQEAASFVLNANIAMIIVLPFLVLNLVYYRLLIIVYVLDAVVYGMILNNTSFAIRKLSISKDSLSCYFALLSIIWFVPEVAAINSITISGMIEALMFHF